MWSLPLYNPPHQALNFSLRLKLHYSWGEYVGDRICLVLGLRFRWQWLPSNCPTLKIKIYKKSGRIWTVILHWCWVRSQGLGKEWQNFTRCPLFLKSNHSCGVTAIKTLQRLIQKWKLNNIQLFCILCHPSPIPILFHIQSSRFKFKSQLSVRRRWVKKVASYSYQDMWPMGDSFCADTYPGANFRLEIWLVKYTALSSFPRTNLGYRIILWILIWVRLSTQYFWVKFQRIEAAQCEMECGH